MRHKIFDIDEILRYVVSWIVQMRRWKDAVNLACCCKSFEEPVLSMVWEKTSLGTLARLLPMDRQETTDGYLTVRTTLLESRPRY